MWVGNMLECVTLCTYPRSAPKADMAPLAVKTRGGGLKYCEADSLAVVGSVIDNGRLQAMQKRQLACNLSCWCSCDQLRHRMSLLTVRVGPALQIAKRVAVTNIRR